MLKHILAKITCKLSQQPWKLYLPTWLILYFISNWLYIITAITDTGTVVVDSQLLLMLQRHEHCPGAREACPHVGLWVRGGGGLCTTSNVTDAAALLGD